MARFCDQFSATNIAALKIAVDAALAALTNPTLRFVDLEVIDQTNRIGLELNLLISRQDSGAALATDFTFEIYQAGSMAALKVLIDAYIAANTSAFISGFRLLTLDTDGQLPSYIGYFIANATAGASANFLPQ